MTKKDKVSKMSAPHASIGYSIHHELLKRITAIKINPKATLVKNISN